MEVSRNGDDKIVRHWTMDDAEKEAARRRSEAFDKMIRARLVPRRGLLARARARFAALCGRLRPLRIPAEKL